MPEPRPPPRPRLAASGDFGSQYRTGDSLVHRLGAGTKLLLGFALGLGAVLARDGGVLAAVVLANAAYWAAAGLGLADLWRDLRYLLWQVAVVVGLHALRAGAAGVPTGLAVSLQIVLFFVPAVVFLRTTRASELMRALSGVLPYRLSFLVFTSLRFIPLFAREMEQIATAQRLRGARLSAAALLTPAGWRDGFQCFVVPLFVRALQAADEASRSAEARGFGLHPQRTYHQPAPPREE